MMLPAALLALAQRLRDQAATLAPNATREDMLEAARYLRACAGAEPVATARQPMTDEQRMLLIMAAFDAVKKPIVVAELCMEITRAVEAFHRIGSEGAKR